MPFLLIKKNALTGLLFEVEASEKWWYIGITHSLASLKQELHDKFTITRSFFFLKVFIFIKKVFNDFLHDTSVTIHVCDTY